MATATERNFLQLRKRLDQLGYRQPLAVDSLLLVEKLFDDLVQTTDGLRQARQDLGDRQQKSDEAQDLIEPYQSENAGLVTENRDLHLRLIQRKDECTAHSRDYKANLRRLEHQNSDLQFLNTQYVVKIKALEREVRDRNDRIQQLQEKNLQATIQTPGGRKKTIAFRRQRMEIDCHVPPAESNNGSAGAGAAAASGGGGTGAGAGAKVARDPYVADLLRVADSRIGKLTAEVRQATEACATKDRRLETLSEQVESRELEIERLGGLLEHGRPRELILAEGKHNSDERLLAQMSIQVEILTEQRQKLEAELQDCSGRLEGAVAQATELEARNGQLCGELRTIQTLSHDLQQEAEHMRAQHGRLHDSVAGQEGELRQCRADLRLKEAALQRAAVDIKCLQELLENGEVDAKHTTRVLEQLDREKRAVEQHCSRLQAAEQSLRDELESLRRVAVSREEERARRTLAEHERVGATLDELSSTATAQREQEGILRERVRHLEENCAHLREERDRHRQRGLREGGHSTAPVQEQQQQRVVGNSATLEEDNKHLQRLLQRFERQLAEIQHDLLAVKEERDSLSLLYQQACQLIDDLRNPPPTSDSPVTSPTRRVPRAGGASPRRQPAAAAQAGVPSSSRRSPASKESPRDVATAARASSVAASNEAAVLKEERSELSARIASLRTLVASLEEQVKASSVATTTATADRNQAESVAEEMRRLLGHSQERVKTLEDELRCSATQYAAVKAQLQSMHGQMRSSSVATTTANTDKSQAESVAEEMRRLLGHSQERVTTLEDELQCSATQYAAVKAQLQSMHGKVAELDSLRSRLQQAGHQVRHGEERGDELERQITHLRQELEKHDQRLRQCCHQRDAESSRVQQLMSEQVTDKRALDALQTELHNTVAEREELKGSIQDYTARLLEFEQALETKEKEKDEILSSFRRLSDERSALDESARQFQEETNSVRVEYSQFLQEHKMLQDTLRHQAQDIRRHQDTTTQHENQSGQLRHQLGVLQKQLQQTEDAMHAAVSERTNARDLCVRLDQARDSLQQDIARLSGDTERLTAALQAERDERAAVAGQLDAERVALKNLESLLALERVETSQKHAQSEHLQAACKQLRQTVTQQADKLAEMEADLATWQRETQNLASQVNDLKRQLTHERYEKQWTLQQLQSGAEQPPEQEREIGTLPSSRSTAAAADSADSHAAAHYPAAPTTAQGEDSLRSSFSASSSGSSGGGAGAGLASERAAGGKSASAGGGVDGRHFSDSSSSVISPLHSPPMPTRHGQPPQQQQQQREHLESRLPSSFATDRSDTSRRSSLPSQHGSVGGGTDLDVSPASARTAHHQQQHSPPQAMTSSSRGTASTSGMGVSPPLTAVARTYHIASGGMQSLPTSPPTALRTSDPALTAGQVGPAIAREGGGGGGGGRPPTASRLPRDIGLPRRTSTAHTTSPLAVAPPSQPSADHRPTSSRAPGAVLTPAPMDGLPSSALASPLMTSSYAGDVSSVLAGHVTSQLRPATSGLASTTTSSQHYSAAAAGAGGGGGTAARSMAVASAPHRQHPQALSGSASSSAAHHALPPSQQLTDSAVFSDATHTLSSAAWRDSPPAAAGGSSAAPASHSLLRPRSGQQFSASEGSGLSSASSVDSPPQATPSSSSRRVTFASRPPPPVLQTPGQATAGGSTSSLDTTTPSPDRLSVSSLSGSSSRSLLSDGSSSGGGVGGSGQFSEPRRQPSDMTVLLLGEQEAYKSMGDKLMEEVMRHHPDGPPPDQEP